MVATAIGQKAKGQEDVQSYCVDVNLPGPAGGIGDIPHRVLRQ